MSYLPPWLDLHGERAGSPLPTRPPHLRRNTQTEEPTTNATAETGRGTRRISSYPDASPAVRARSPLLRARSFPVYRSSAAVWLVLDGDSITKVTRRFSSAPISSFAAPAITSRSSP